MSTPQSIREAIRKANQQAIMAGKQLDKTALADLLRIYEQAVNDIALRIQASATDGMVRLNNLRELQRQVEQVLEELSLIQHDLLENNLAQGAALGAGVWKEAIPEQIATITDEAVRAARNFQAADGLQLSDRLWRVDRHAKEVIGRAIESAVIQGHSASQAAQDFTLRGEIIPAELQKKMKLANASKISRVTTTELLKANGSPYDYAKRVFRTEINRAHGIAYQTSAFELDDVAGTRFLLSPNHPEPDICDMHAKANRYGLGKGVYPKGKSPWPAHPNTLSYEEVVFADEVSNEDRAGKQSKIDWLHDQSYLTQYQVLASRKKVEALQAGLLKENDIDRPWKEIKHKYEGDL